MSTPRYLTAACLLSALAYVLPATADEPDPAEVLFDQGVEYMGAKHFNKACPLIQQSYRLDPRPGTLFTLAECEAQRGRIATAVVRYEEYLALFATLPPSIKAKQDNRAEVSRAQVTILKPQVPRLTLQLRPNAPLGTLVKRDGAQVAPAEIGVASLVDPGKYLITVKEPGRPVMETWVTIERGEKKQVMLGGSQASSSGASPVEPGENRIVTKEPSRPTVETWENIENGEKQQVTLKGTQASSSGAPPVAGSGGRTGVLVSGGVLTFVGLGLGVGMTIAANATSHRADAQLRQLSLNTPTTEILCGPSMFLPNQASCTSLKETLRMQDRLTDIAVAGYVVGSVAAVGTLILLHWPKTPARSSGLIAVPVVGSDHGGVSVVGSF